MGRKKLAKNIGKRGPMFRCEHGHIRCKGGKACEEAFLLSCGVGTRTAWKPEFNHEVLKYFDMESYKIHYDDKGRPYPLLINKFPTVEGFAFKIGVSVDTLYEWAKPSHTLESDEKCAKYPGFSEAFTRARERQKQFMNEAALAGALNPTYAALFAQSNFGMKNAIDHTNDGGRFEPPQIVDYSQTPYKLNP